MPHHFTTDVLELRAVALTISVGESAVGKSSEQGKQRLFSLLSPIGPYFSL